MSQFARTLYTTKAIFRLEGGDGDSDSDSDAASDASNDGADSDNLGDGLDYDPCTTPV